MRSGKRKPGGAMVKLDALPCKVCVAGAAVLRETGRRMIRCGRFFEILHMARSTRGGSCRILSGNVAILACQLHVSPGQGKFCAVVIEPDFLPLYRSVARAAILTEPGVHVAGISGPAKVRHVTGSARCWSSCVFV